MEAAFAVGDKAVYPTHGVTEVVGLERRDIHGCAITVYVLEVVENGSRIVVPTKNAEAVGLRQIIPDGEVDKVLAILGARPDTPVNLTWNRRQREYTDKLKTGDVYEIAEVLRDLNLLGEGKQLSFSERRLLETARNLLVQEIALARNEPAVLIGNEIDAILGAATAPAKGANQ